MSIYEKQFERAKEQAKLMWSKVDTLMAGTGFTLRPAKGQEYTAPHNQTRVVFKGTDEELKALVAWLKSLPKE